MTPKEKAINLIDKMSTHDRDIHPHCTHYIAKQCALIAVDEILNENSKRAGENDEIVEYEPFWQKVKQEIEKL
jgi:hypothetical protein